MYQKVLPRELERRVTRLQECLLQQSLDGVLLFKNVHLFYFTGSVPHGALFIPAAGSPLILVRKGAARVREDSPWPQLIPIKGYFQLPVKLAEAAVKLQQIGLELNDIPAALYQQLVAAFPQTTFHNISSLLGHLRMIKSSWEISQIRQAGQQLAQGFAALQEKLQPGISELELAATFEQAMRLAGHQGMVRLSNFSRSLFYGTVSAGASAACSIPFDGPVGGQGLYPAVPGGAGRHRIEAGETILVDMVGGCNGYLADQTRVFVIGQAPAQLVAAQEFIVELMTWLETQLEPGRPLNELYQQIQARVAQAGYQEFFMNHGENQVRFIAHGIGLELDEPPVMAAKCTTALAPGQVLAIEPKIIFPTGGVGLENTYHITAQGVENLTPYPEGLHL